MASLLRFFAGLSLLTVACGPAASSFSAVPAPPVVEVEVSSEQAKAEEPVIRAPAEMLYDEVRDPEALLVDDIERTELRRAYLVDAADGYWTLARAQAGEVDLEGMRQPRGRHELVVTEVHPKHLRVLVAGQGVEVVAYVNREAFVKTTRERVQLAPTDGGAISEAQVSLPPGAMVKVIGQRRGRLQVTVEAGWFTAVGSILPAAFGRVFRRDQPKSDHHGHWQGTFPCSVAAGTVLRTSSGAEIARLGSSSAPCSEVEELDDGYRVVLSRDGYRIEGVAAKAQVSRGRTGRGYGTSGRGRGGWGASHSTYRYLWPGDRLYSSDQLVGRVMGRRFRVADRGAKGTDMHLVHTHLPLWGFEDLLVARATIQAAIDKNTRYLNRVTFDHILGASSAKKRALVEALEGRREQMNRCFDATQKRGHMGPFRYRVDLVLGKSKLTAQSSSQKTLDSCLQRNVDLVGQRGARLRFDLVLTSDPAVDAGG